MRRERNVLDSADGVGTADHIYAACRAGGAQALGVPMDEIRPGDAATLISLDDGDSSMIALRPAEILARWVFAARAPIVDGVWRRGHKVVSAGRHHQRDAIVYRYRRALARLRA